MVSTEERGFKLFLNSDIKSKTLIARTSCYGILKEFGVLRNFFHGRSGFFKDQDLIFACFLVGDLF